MDQEQEVKLLARGIIFCNTKIEDTKKALEDNKKRGRVLQGILYTAIKEKEEYEVKVDNINTNKVA